MALKRAGLQPVGTQPTYAKTSGRNAYAGYGSKTTETDEDKKGLDPGTVNAGILGAMAAKSGYDWADKNGYVDRAKEWMFGPSDGSSYFAGGAAGSASNPNGMQASGPWGNADGSFMEGAAGTGFGNPQLGNAGAGVVNGGEYAMDMAAPYAAAGTNAALSANAGMQAANAATQASTEVMPWMLTTAL